MKKRKKIFRHPKVIFKKLGREGGIDGQSQDYGIYGKEIEINIGVIGKNLLETFIHERLHFILPDLHEKIEGKYKTNGVYEASEILADFLWKHGYRRIDDGVWLKKNKKNGGHTDGKI